MGRVTVLALAIGTALAADPATASETNPIRLPVAIGTDSPGSVVVEPGDHLWKISARHLSEVRNEAPASADIAPYWRRVIENNTPRLRSGDPDLIYPGEVIIYISRWRVLSLLLIFSRSTSAPR